MRHHIATKILVLCFLIAAFSCNSRNNNLPKGILSEEEMVAVITDLQLIEASHQLLNRTNMDQKSMRDTSYHIIFNQHETTIEQFDSSLKVYTRHPKIFSEIMKTVNENLNQTK
jgi:hypothetical protein